MERHRHVSLDSLAGAALAAVVVLSAVAVALLHWGGSEWQRSGVMALSGFVAVGLVLTLAIRRSRSLARMEDVAERMLAVDRPRRGGAIPAVVRDDALPVDLVPLNHALEELGHRIEVQLKEVAKKSRNLEALIDAMDEPLLATDNAERVILCNRSAEAIFGSGPEGLNGRPISEVLTQSTFLEMHAAARSGQTRRSRVRAATPLGQRVFQVSASPVPVAWGEGIFGAVMVFRDVTELDQAVQIKTDFVANASHELRTPVAAIRGAAETLQSTGDDPAMAERLRGMILQHALRLQEMLRDLLDLSRLESPEVALRIAPIDLAETASTMRGLFEADLEQRRLRLVFDYDDDLDGFATDRKLLTLMLRNLIENATKFAFEGTEIRVRGSVVEAEVAPVNGKYPPPSPITGPTRGVVRFEVADQGVGVPINLQERVFERYYQVDPARNGAINKRGTGLGLAIVKHAAKALGGRAGLKSVWGEGTTAYVEFPVQFGIDEEPAPAPE